MPITKFNSIYLNSTNKISGKPLQDLSNIQGLMTASVSEELSRWASWDETEESGIADDNTFVVFFDNPSNSTDEVGQGGGLSEANRTMSQAGGVAGAVDGFRRCPDGDYFDIAGGIRSDLLDSQSEFTVVLKVKDENKNTTGQYHYLLDYRPVLIEHEAGGTPVQRLRYRDGSSTWHNMEFTNRPTTGVVYYYIWMDANYLRSGWSTTKCDKWSDFPSDQRSSIDVNFSAGSGPGSYDSIGGINYGTDNTDVKLGYWVVAKECLIDNDS